jgi:MoaA/NifB/PqqE/SkfB family radical SAM enzyme
MYRAIERRLINWIQRDPRPFPIQLDITNACNLRCSHCYHSHHDNSGVLTLEQWQGILVQYDRLRRKLGYDAQLILCGGEPMLSPLLLPIIRFARSLDASIPVSILTNGTHTPSHLLESLKEYGNIQFQVSVEGATAYSHDPIRGKGNFARSEAGVRTLRNAGFDVHLLCTLSARTRSEIFPLFQLAKEWGVSSMNFTRFIAIGSGFTLANSNLDAALSPQDLRSAYGAIVRASARTLVRTSTRSPLFHLIHPSLGRNGLFGEGLVVDYQGRILASSRSRLEIGNVRTSTLERIVLDHPILRAIRRGEIDGCGDCRHFRRCGGDRNAAFAATGNYLGPDPGCWIRAEKKESEEPWGSFVNCAG